MRLQTHNSVLTGGSAAGCNPAPAGGIRKSLRRVLDGIITHTRRPHAATREHGRLRNVGRRRHRWFKLRHTAREKNGQIWGVCREV